MKNIERLMLLGAMILTPAFAVDVSYSTTGTFGSSGTAVFTGPHSLQITFTGTPLDLPNVSAPPVSYAPFGTFTVTGPAPTFTDTVSDNFTLKVTQSLPAPGGTETVIDTVAGNIRIANSQVTVTFTSGSGDGGVAVASLDPLNGSSALKFSFANVTYWVDKVTPIHPQTGSGVPGVSIINGAIDATEVPEPAFYGLTGTGFAGLLWMALRRRRQQQQQQVQ